ncbi:MAG: hypothetical protein IT578_05065 [Verrucomicrobiae bacterium]|nr:hypothetical protein [Verrucomicrobiae bacterium]
MIPIPPTSHGCLGSSFAKAFSRPIAHAIGGLTLAAGLLIAPGGNARAADNNSVVFSLSFDHGLEPEIAEGNPSGKYLRTDEDPRFVPGLKGKGFLTGKSKQGLEFAAEGNVPQEEGTVAFWMKGLPGVTWNKVDQQHHCAFYLNGSNGNLILYKYFQYAHTWLFGEFFSGDQKRSTSHIILPAYSEDEWHLFAFTWKGSEVSLYLDAELAGTKVDFQFPTLSKTSKFILGECMEMPGEDLRMEERVMDEVAIYRQALSAHEIAGIYRTQGEVAPRQKLSLGRTRQTIAIDGRIEPDEWREATVAPVAIDLAHGRVTDTPSQVWLTYDAQNLYLAFRSPLPESDLANPHMKLLAGFFKKDRLTHDESVDDDDSLELLLVPNPNAKDGGDCHRMVVNTVDTTYDYVLRGSGEIDLKWNPSWQVKSRVDAAGWNLEARIPFSAFGAGAPADGTVWKVNFSRIWRQLRTEKDSWNFGRRASLRGEPEKFSLGELVFRGDRNVAVRPVALGPLFRGDLDLKLELTGPRTGTAQTRIAVSSSEGVVTNKTTTVSAERPVTWTLQKNLTETDSLWVRLQATDPGSTNVYYGLELPLYLKKDLSFRLRSYPSTNRLRVEGDFSRLAVAPAEVKGTIEIRAGDRVETKTFLPKSTAVAEEFDVSKLPTGPCEIVLSLHKGPALMARQKLSFDKKARPEWFGNSLGQSADVPPPWTPLQVRETDTVCSWGREYAYGGKLLPVQIQTQGAGILARPMTLTLVTDKKTTELNTLPSKQSAPEQSATRVAWKKDAKTDALRVECASSTEFDGMNWTELRVIPTHGKVKIQSLILTLPLKKEWATLINAYDYSLRDTGALRPDGWSGSLRPLWLGNETGGVQFFAESSLAWVTDNRQKELEVVRDGNETLLKVNLINAPFVLESERTFAFGFEATPVRPAPPDYRRWRIGNSSYVSSVTPEKGIEVLQAWHTSWAKVYHSISGEESYPLPGPRCTPGAFDGSLPDGRKTFAFPYFQICQAWAESPEFKQFGDEWLNNIHDVYMPAPGSPASDRTMPVCPAARSFEDFTVWGLRQLQTRSKPRGYYLDVSQPGPCNNIHHGCGQIVEGSSAIQTTFNIRGAREMVKRLYIDLKHERSDGMIIYHNSGMICLPALGFADLIVDGENFNSLLDRKQNRGYENVLGLATYRAEYMGHNFGPKVALLPEFGRSISRSEAAQVGPQHQEYLHGLILLHDSQIWLCDFLYDDAVARRLYEALARYDFALASYEFIPYWRQTVTQPLNPKTTVASFYADRTKKRTLLVAMNLTGKAAGLRLELNAQQLGLDLSRIEVRNVCHSEPVKLDGNVLTIASCPSHAYRLIALEEKPEIKTSG